MRNATAMVIMVFCLGRRVGNFSNIVKSIVDPILTTYFESVDAVRGSLF
jgi:hypothetical protein